MSSNDRPPEAIFDALGHVVFSFVALEDALHDAIWMAMRQTAQARILTSGLPFRALVEKFGAIYADCNHQSFDGAGPAPLCKLLLDLNDERNRQIHASWGFWAESKQPVRLRKRLRGAAGLSVEMVTVQPAQVLELSARMDRAADKVWEVCLDWTDPSSPELPPVAG